MAAYVIADITVTDPDRYAEYAARTPAIAAAHGGRFVVRGGDVEVAEGDWAPGRLVVLEFPSMAAARGWYASPEYQEARAIREEASTGRVLFVEGWEG